MLTATIKPLTPTDCFFTLNRNGSLWIPGWIIGEIILPIASHTNKFYLVWDSTGDAYWVAANCTRKRGELDNFNHNYYSSSGGFDWLKYHQFPKINDRIPSAGNSETTPPNNQEL